MIKKHDNPPMKSAYYACFGQLGIYVLQHLITPPIRQFGMGSDGHTFIFCSTIIISFLVMYHFVDKMRLWLLTWPAYIFALLLFNPFTSYNTGYYPDFYWIMQFYIDFLVLIAETCAWIFVKIIKKY